MRRREGQGGGKSRQRRTEATECGRRGHSDRAEPGQAQRQPREGGCEGCGLNSNCSRATAPARAEGPPCSTVAWVLLEGVLISANLVGSIPSLQSAWTSISTALLELSVK